MKKTLVLVTVFVVGLAFSAYAQTATETKQTTKVQGATTTTTDTVKVKNDKVDVKAKETVTTNVNKPGETTATTEIKGKRGEAKRTVTEDASGNLAGTTKVDTKKGAIEDLKIDWTYEKVKVTGGGYNYVIKYNVKENKNANLAKELGLNPDQAKMITVGEHTITSTSEFTAGDVQTNFRSYILKDLKQVIAKEEAAKAKTK